MSKDSRILFFYCSYLFATKLTQWLPIIGVSLFFIEKLRVKLVLKEAGFKMCLYTWGIAVNPELLPLLQWS